MALEKRLLDRRLNSGEAAECRRVVDTELIGGTRQAALIGDGSYEAEVIPIRHGQLSFPKNLASMSLASMQNNFCRSRHFRKAREGRYQRQENGCAAASRNLE
ncbi:hypothetical protein [Methylobacterium sp. 77]|uniref:hypothetical protein n=1 Tax=Methylobacterium sp. 77 TaxID=1101192 RepID=UPI001FD9EF37|nr:hypothetical protein [Methylobacterium sp. 77]